jgi:uncharacterized protein (PEP-CTERM system associated)
MTRVRRCAYATAALTAYVLLAARPAWAADPAPDEPARDFSITPKLGVQESFTDNALLTASNMRSDFVTRLNASAIVNVDTGRTKATIDSAASYDQYANNSDLSGWSLYGNGNGAYTVIPGALSLEAEGSITNGTVSTFGTSAIDRSGTVGRVQLATYDVGPRFTTTLDDFADVNLLGRFAQVLYNSSDTSNVMALPADSSIVDIVAVLGTGTRFPWYELTTTGNYERDDHGFQLYNGLQSGFFRVMPELRLVARAGYDDITQPGVVDIRAPIARGGLELSINRLSKITVEGGVRYNHATWNADVYLQFSDRIYFTGRYFEILEPAQIQIHNSFSDFVNMSRLLPTPIAPENFAVTGNLYNQTSLSKTAEARLVYQWEADSISLDASWDDRRFLATNDHDRVLTGNAAYYRRIAPDLVAEVRASYAQTFASPIYGASSSYGGELSLSYDINSQMVARAGYATNQQTQTSPLHQSLSENVIFAAVERRF